MIEDISIKDFALIDSLSLDLRAGFTVFTGETGTGKSVLIGSISFLLGGKPQADTVRTGADEAWAAGTVCVEGNKDALAWLEEHGIEADSGRVLLKRNAKAGGRSSCWIQGVPVARAELAEFTSFLVDIHGQHDHQSLMKPQEHRRFLDAYAGIEEEVAAFSALYAELAAARKKRDELDEAEKTRAEKMELLIFAVKEIKDASLEAGEDEALEAEEKRLSQHERLISCLDQCAAALGAGSASSLQEGAIPLLKKALSLLESASAVDPSLSAQAARLENVFYEAEDAASEIAAYLGSALFDPARLQAVEERLSLLYKLKKKYGPSLDDVMAHGAAAEKELEELANASESRASLDAEIAALEKRLVADGNVLSQKRQAAAAVMEKGVEEVLASLSMAGTRFKVRLVPKESSNGGRTASQYGFDDVEFMISPNPGEPLKPLSKIASGGEISRVMLALKTVLADADKIDTLIFDEIDVGIGGETAVAVGSHIHRLSRGRQILCITHLASIACQADNHIVIEKSFDSEKTRTGAREIGGDERAEEISRMLSGGGGGTLSLDHARELLEKYSLRESQCQE